MTNINIQKSSFEIKCVSKTCSNERETGHCDSKTLKIVAVNFSKKKKKDQMSREIIKHLSFPEMIY